MDISPDSLTLLLLCSQLAIEDDTPQPMTLREWNPIARKLTAANLRPADLLEGQNLKNVFTKDEVERVMFLTARADALQRVLDRLSLLGIFPLTRADEGYPQRYRQRLQESAPPVLFYAGEIALLGQPGIAVVGSRHLDEAGQECARYVGNACGIAGQVLYSGGARGVDTISMKAALEARGTAVAVLADSLERAVRARKSKLQRGDLCLLTPYNPSSGFSVGAAMGRNRLIYALADYAIVVASDAESGGTWAGATEALKHSWLPVFVLEHEGMPEGNRLLIQKGGLPFPHPFQEPPLKLQAWLREKSGNQLKPAGQLSLF